ncbi:type VII secretion integral membrane protein EccD, partial [Micromonospora zhanjiangensis]
AGAGVAAAGLPYAVVGGALVAAPSGLALDVTQLGASNLLLGSAALLLFSIVGYTGVAAVQRLFMAGIALSLTGLLAALLSLGGTAPAGAAAVSLTVVIGLLPGYPLIASWIGRLPVPELPNRPEEILADRPVPKRSDVFAAVARATELLTGMLLAAAISSTVAMVVLVIVDRQFAGGLLALAGSAALLLRARLFGGPHQRVPMLAAGIAGLGLLALGYALSSGTGGRLLVLALLILAAAAVLAAGLLYSKRNPSPYLGRAADILDVLAIIALIPLACAVTGL